MLPLEGGRWAGSNASGLFIFLQHLFATNAMILWWDGSSFTRVYWV